MRMFAVLLTGVLLPTVAMAADAPGPDWAFMTPDANAPAATGNAQAAAPAAQPGAPAIVVAGKGNAVPACSSCHAPSGVGGPESANLRALHPDYFIRQVGDFKSGNRGGPRATGGAIANGLIDADIEEIAKYYAGLSPMQSARIVESATVPKTIVGRNSQRTKLPGNDTEPLGKRIVEIPDTPAAGQPAYVAYVPPGSLAAGEALVKGSKTEECASCHGDGLLGSDDIPRIAGRSPVYIARQLYSFKNGVRKGDYADVMKSIVADFTDDDIIAIASYVGSRNPS